MLTAVSMSFNTSVVSAPANSTSSAIADFQHRFQLEQIQQDKLLALQVAAAQPQPPEVGICLQMAGTDEETRRLACLQRARLK